MADLRISAIIPVRDGAAYIEEALRSVFAQTLAPVEVIVVDDGSSDGSASIAGGFEGVRVLKQDGRGIGAARNRAVEESSGDALAFLDADDIWIDSKSEIQAALIGTGRANRIARGGVEQFLSPELPPERPTGAVPEGPAAMIQAGAMLIGRGAWERVGPFDEELRVGEMLEWLLRARRRGCTEEIHDELVLRRRVHDTNTSLRRAGELGAFARILKHDLDAKRAAGERGPEAPA